MPTCSASSRPTAICPEARDAKARSQWKSVPATSRSCAAFSGFVRTRANIRQRERSTYFAAVHRSSGAWDADQDRLLMEAPSIIEAANVLGRSYKSGNLRRWRLLNGQ